MQLTGSNSDNSRMRKLIALLSLSASLAGAQDAVDEAAVQEEPIRRYTVEVIVFSYAENVSTGSEIFLPDDPPPDEELPYDEDGNPIVPAEDEIPEYGDVIEVDVDSEPLNWIVVPAFVDEPDAEEPNPFQLVLLTEDELMLGDVADRFELLDAYETLLHFGWVQPTFPAEETPPIELQLLAVPPERLAGSLTLYLSRYLHLVVDLALDAPAEFEEEVVDEESFFSFGDSRSAYDDPFDTPLMPVRFRIQENRIVKNAELRYFDHPKFGVLAKVTRVEEPEEDDQDESAALTGSSVQ